MNTPTEGFELSSTTLRGTTVAVDYHHAQNILRTEQKNPEVVFEVYATEPGILSGMNEVMALLQRRLPTGSSSVLSLSDGDVIATGETVLSITASYATFGLYRDVITGLLASNTGWASAADRCVKAADGVPVVVGGSSQIHPEIVGLMEYSARVGGCAAVSTQDGGDLTTTVPYGAMSHEFILIWGSAERAMTLFDRHARLGIQRVIPVPTIGDAVQEALDAAYALSSPQRNSLRSVRLDIPDNLGGGSPAFAIELKDRLVDAGFPSVDLHMSGDLTPDSIAEHVAAGSPISLFVVDRYIASASSVPFASGIKEIDGKSIAPRGMSPGPKPNVRMIIRDMV